MDLSHPYEVLLPRIEGRIAEVVAGTTRPLSGREVARLAATPRSGTWRTLTRLVDHGIVLRQEAGGGTLLYTLNRYHVAAEAVLLLSDLQGRLFERMRASLLAWNPRPVHVSVFGSAARRDGDTSSDIDLFVVRPSGVAESHKQWRSQIDTLANDVVGWSGNHLGVVDVSLAATRRLGRERPPIVAELETDAITLVGQPVREILSMSR